MQTETQSKTEVAHLVRDEVPSASVPTRQTAVGYLRVSTDMQEDSGLGLDAQRDQIQTYATQKGIEVVRWYRDTTSGTTHVDQRQGLSQLVKDLESNQIVLVSKRDRLSRDLMLSLWIEKEISKVHCSLESCDGAGNGDSPTDKLLKNLILAFGEFERSMIAERTRAAMKSLAKTRKIGRPPFGFKYDSSGQLKKDPSTHPTLQLIRELHNEGINPSRIAKMLNEKGFKSQTGKSFSRNVVFQIVSRLADTKAAH